MANENLNKAKVAKQDEFYTQLSDIEKELQHYKHHFKGKVVYCNCDDPQKLSIEEAFTKPYSRNGKKKV